MPTRKQSQDEIRQHLAEQLDWRFAERNDQAVAQVLYAGQAVDAVHTLDEAGLLDGFFAFLKESGVMAVDGTQIVTSPEFTGCGCLKTTHSQRNEQGMQVKVVELVYGWRLIALIDLVTLIPLAIRIVQIQDHEAPYLLALVDQAQSNLAPHSRIVHLVVDRAYVDGKTLYALDQMGIAFVLHPGGSRKTTMAAYITALAKSVEAPLCYERIETVTHGHGRNQERESWLTRVETASDIRTWESYRPPLQAGKHLRHEKRPALNAVLVRMWRNHDLQAQPRIYLTNRPVVDPWSIVDLYDDRSWIENGLFRNSKQFWHLTRNFPKRSQAGVHSHLTFVVLMVATATAYRLWDKAQSTATPAAQPVPKTITHRMVNRTTGEILPDARTLSPLADHLAAPPWNSLDQSPSADDVDTPFSHHLLDAQGVQRWRRQLQRENRDKLIVFIEDHYGIFDTHEFLVLTGVPLRTIPPHLGAREDILRRYGCLEHPP